MSRFDPVDYDQEAIEESNKAKELCRDLDHFIEVHVKNGRPKSMALTKLEECYMWIEKAIRDDQISRQGPKD
jgi:hypothetical protein